MNIKQSLTILGLTDAATVKQLQLAYRKGVRQWHPDRFQQETEQRREQAEEMMRELNLAFELLSEHHKKHGDFKEVFEKPVIHTPPPSYHKKPAKPESEDLVEDPVIPGRKTGRNRIWFGFALSMLAGYFIFSGFTLEDNSQVNVDVNSKSESNQLTSDEIVNDIPQETTDSAPNATKITKETDTAEILARLKKPEIKKEEKSAFETRSVFLKEETLDPGDSFFTYGDTIGKVYEIQGIPSKTDGDIWYYGSSEVHFKNGRVVAWENTGRPMLKVKY